MFLNHKNRYLKTGPFLFAKDNSKQVVKIWNHPVYRRVTRYHGEDRHYRPPPSLMGKTEHGKTVDRTAKEVGVDSRQSLAEIVRVHHLNPDNTSSLLLRSH